MSVPTREQLQDAVDRLRSKDRGGRPRLARVILATLEARLLVGKSTI